MASVLKPGPKGTQSTFFTFLVFSALTAITPIATYYFSVHRYFDGAAAPRPRPLRRWPTPR